MIKCRGEQHKCLHLGNTCDDIIDCPQGDDEYLCELKHHKCPNKCICLALAIECLNFDQSSFNTQFYPYISVLISLSYSLGLDNIVSAFNKAKYVTIKHNNIFKVCYIFTFKFIFLLDLSHNYVYSMKKHCFADLYYIKSIILHNNNITFVENHAFYNLIYLKILDLSNNFLTQFCGSIIKDTSLKLLVLKNISTKYLDKNLFEGINFGIIHTNDYKLCCIATLQSVCTATIPWYISCNNISLNLMLKWCFIIMSILIIAINGTSIVIHLIVRSSKAYFICVVAVNISDIICGVYLGIIWIADVTLEGDFTLNDVKWRSGPICFLAFGILLYFTVVNQLALILLALSRLMIVINPLHTAFKNIRYAFGHATAIYIMSSLLIAVPLLSLMLKEEVLPKNLCLPFTDPTSSIFTIKGFGLVCYL